MGRNRGTGVSEAEQTGAAEVAYCGLVCDPVCIHARSGCVGCRAGGGPDSCDLRRCCEERGIEGCWQCISFPCAKGASGDDAWRGLNVGCVQMIVDMGAATFAALAVLRLGDGFDYGYLRYQTPDHVQAILHGEADIPREDPDVRRQG